MLSPYHNGTYDSLFSIPVRDVLSHFGKRTDHRGYMYYSPFRDETTPSMRVTVNRIDGTWVWADYGGEPRAGRKVDGGGVLEMVRRLSGVSSNREAIGVLEKIAGGVLPAPVPSANPVIRKKPAGGGNSVIIDEVRGVFTHHSLRDYAVNVRKIPEPLLIRYCRQVRYHVRSDSSRSYTAIGFPNDAGGFALRGCSQKSKINSLWGLSTLSADGVPGEKGSSECLLFEGFMDFLSYMAWNGLDTPGADICVLHSASNVVLAQDRIQSHAAVRTYFDADHAGDVATRSVKRWCESSGLSFCDERALYRGAKDLNEAWQIVSHSKKKHVMSR